MNQQHSDPMEPIPYTVQGVTQETADTYTLLLKPEDGMAIKPFRPGQFNMLYAFGIGEVPISISSAPSKPRVMSHTVRAVGEVTKALCSMKPGDVMGIRGPFGSQWPVKQAEGKDIVVLAGGLGLAPLRSVIYHVLASRDRYGRLMILYGARSPSEMLYEKELHEWRSRFDVEVLVIVDRADSSWRGDVGVVTRLVPLAGFDPIDTVAYVCGPEIMMRFCTSELEHHGLEPQQIFLSMERNMKCAVGFCGHCQFGPHFICKDGPVLSYTRVKRLSHVMEV